tara:strand:- start:4628 stop:4831 length:204 start_codon:yes stop_codon:yes gene_type:complete
MTLQFESFFDALWMDGHGFYVWLAVGISVVILISMVFIPVWSHKQFMINLKINSPDFNKKPREEETE